MREAKQDYKDKTEILTNQKAMAENTCKSLMGTINNLPREISLAKNIASDKTMPQNSRNSAKKNIKRYSKELAQAKIDFKKNQETLLRSSAEFSEIQKQVPGETYFKKIDKTNMSKERCGQILDGKFKVLEIIDDTRVIAEMAIEPYYVKGSTKLKYHTIQVQIKTESTQKLKSKQIVKTNEVYQIIATNSNEGKPQLILEPVKISN
ncbi:MAG TPA: hypothetical protein PLK08_01160 [Phycisphaerae bacterium]|nr:hypothetical protein [Phycisphaerae bacterium]